MAMSSIHLPIASKIDSISHHAIHPIYEAYGGMQLRSLFLPHVIGSFYKRCISKGSVIALCR